MDFLVTSEFLAVYEALTDEQAELVDAAISRVLESPGSPWARRDRIVGDAGGAWLVEARDGDDMLALYWSQRDDETIVLLLLVVRSPE